MTPAALEQHDSGLSYSGSYVTYRVRFATTESGAKHLPPLEPGGIGFVLPDDNL